MSEQVPEGGESGGWADLYASAWMLKNTELRYSSMRTKTPKNSNVWSPCDLAEIENQVHFMI